MIELFTGRDATYLPDVGKMPYEDQGSQNACGTTSLAMALTYHGINRNHHQIDTAIRRWDTFTAPDELIWYARKNDGSAEGYNNGRWHDVKAHIDNGNPCLFCINADYKYPSSETGTLEGLHYVVVTGYGRDAKTNQEFLVFHDPNRGDVPKNGTTGHDYQGWVKDFQKLWDSVGWGFHNYYIAIGPAGRVLPRGSDDGIEGSLTTLEGVTDLTNGLDRIGTGRVKGIIHGVFQVVAGIIETVVGAIGGIVQVIGQWIHDVVEDVPVVRNIVQPIGDLINGAGAVIADIGKGIGSVIEDVGRFFGNLFTGDTAGAGDAINDFFEDATDTVINTVADTAGAVVDAVEDFFSGW